ncbi:EAL domain-containing protein [Ruminococcaceae bacterium OttesenSCG-928-L11]|nr:EAL domain-containing protein [Ruminococcaceae bacterium OttesenSCG-928-L11]
MPVIVILIAAAIIAIAFFAAKMIRIERIEGKQSKKAAEEEQAQEETESEEPEELVNLVDYFGSDKKDNGEEEEKPPQPEEEVSYDKLSDFLNGRAYINACEKKLRAAKDEGALYAVASLDIDRFRFINSIKGVSLGDYVLSHLAQELQAIFPDESVITRISADHFSVLFPIGENTSYEELAGEIRKACDKIRTDIAFKSAIRVCMGIAESKPPQAVNAYNMGVLFHKANLARHCLKLDKNETFSVYVENMVTSNLFGESAVEDYSENQYGDEFIVYYQPITDLSKNAIYGCEGLVHWLCQDNSSEPITPDTGKIPTNTTKVIYQICKAASRWRKSGKEMPCLFMNLTDVEFFKADIDEFFAKCLSEFQLDPGDVCVTVDANVLRVDYTTSMNQLKRLRDTGVRVGVGNIDVSMQSLDFLRGLPLQFIKTNRSFTRDILANSEREESVKAVLTLAEGLNIKAIFEGVNSIDQMNAVHGAGVNLIEGKYSGSPTVAEEFARLLKEKTSQRTMDTTVILSEKELNKGDYNI